MTGKRQYESNGSGKKYSPRLDQNRNKLPYGKGMNNHNTGEKLKMVTCIGSRIKKSSC